MSENMQRDLDRLRVAASGKVEEKNYWLRALEGLESRSLFPPDFNRQASSGPLDRQVDVPCPQDVWERLSGVSGGSDARLHVLVTAGFALLLERYTGNRDVVVCAPLLDADGAAEMINTVVPLRIAMDGATPFRSFLGAVRSVISAAYQHRNFPIEILEELLQADGRQEGMLRDLAVMVEPFHNEAVLDVANVRMAAILRRRESGGLLTLRYDGALYREDTVRRFAEHFFTLMQHALSAPDALLDTIPIISAPERELVLNTFARHGGPYPADVTLAEMFALQVERHGDRVACVEDDRFLTYGELDRRAGWLAAGIPPGCGHIGLMVGDNLALPLGIMAVMKSGGCLLPLSPSNPVRRLAFVIDDCRPEVLLADRRNMDRARELQRLCPSVRQLECVDDWAELDAAPTEAHHQCPGPVLDSPCYTVYTSGSTGKPKGVRVAHGTLSPLIHWAAEYYGLGPQTKCQHILPFIFDFGLLEIFSTLLSGGVLYMADIFATVVQRPFADSILKYGIDTIHATPSLLKRLAPENGSLAGIKVLHLGGERLTAEFVHAVAPLLDNDCLIYNGYGPTETSITATMAALTVDEALALDPATDIPIGKPVSNNSLYILDKNLHPLPIGVVGEICIGGGGVAPGYLNRPQLTAERFVADPFQPGKRMYMSGDLGRWLPDGSILFAGRIDLQVKIRGYRIELGEIESRLLEVDAITRAVVIDRDMEIAAGSGSGERYLCAYVTVKGELNEGAVREALLETLPDYMVPAYIVPLDTFPLTPNGKIDRKALPAPAAKGAVKPPSNELERVLCRIWARLLKVDLEIVGIDTNVFELGANSLTVTAFVSAVFKELHVNLEIAEVFARPYVAQLAPLLTGMDTLRLLDIEPREKMDYYEISYAQRRLWILCQFDEDSSAYNIPGAVMVTGPFDPATFTEAVGLLARRHESLRTSFTLVRGEPRQRVCDALEPPVVCHDLSHLPEAEAEERARALYMEDANRVFNLTRAPLFRFTVARLAHERFLVASNIHHIVSDGWSQGIIGREIIRIYNSLRAGHSWDPQALTVHYKDYTHWHNQLVRGGVLSHCRDYWLDKFADKPNGVALPLDHNRPSVQTFNGGRVVFSIDRTVRDSLVAVCRQREATLFMGLLTVVTVLLGRYSGQEDIVLGSPIAARKHPALHPIVGFFVNTLVYRPRLEVNAGFMDLLEAVKQEALDCYKYQDYPFDLMVEELDLQRDLSQSPVFNVMLAHNNTDTRDAAAPVKELTVEPFFRSKEFNMSKFDLTFFIDDGERGLYTRIEYNSDLFDRSTIQRMGRNLQVLLEDCLARPEVPVHSLNLLTGEEREMVMSTFNRTACPFRDVSVVRLLREQAERTPDRTAVLFHDAALTYGECHRLSSRWAHWLRDRHGVSANDIIGLYIPRSLEMVVAMLGVLKAGAGYLALDPGYPEERLLYVLEDSETEMVLNGRPENSAMFIRYDGQVIDAIEAAAQMDGCNDGDPGIEPDAGDILYVNYTSGSTGTPNGALLTHGNLSNLIQWQAGRSTIDTSLRCLQFTSINFCVSFQEIMGTLTGGGQLVLIGHVERQDTMSLCRFLQRFCIETLYLPFSYLNFLFNESSPWDGRVGGYLKHIVTAGEQLKISSGLKKYLETHRDVRLHNHYGSTEMHVVTSFSMDSRTALSRLVPPVGKPVSNVNIYILDDQLNPVPIGVYGELCVAGSHDIAGYIDNPSLNAAKLIANPFDRNNGRRLYRSGDLGRWLESGDIELGGRKDYQVKIRGFRVEPGEIESQVLTVAGVRECAVVVKEDPSGQKFLAAYISTDGVDADFVESVLFKSLPRYMIPMLVPMESLPLMPNGKIDLARLPEPEPESKTDVRPPENETQRELARLWIEILDLGLDYPLGVDADFFALGGHSLKATVLVARIHRDMGVDVSLSDFFKGPTIRELAALIEDSSPQEFKELLSIGEKDFYSLSFHQERMLALQLMAPESAAYNMPGRVALDHDVDPDFITAAVKMLLQRHHSLRTGFVRRDGEAGQFIADAVETPVEYHDLSSMAPAERDQRLGQLAGSVARHCFDLAEPPLLRVVLVKSGDQRSDLLFCMHHIISDGWSIQILKREFAAIYEHLRSNALLALQPLEFRYVDFADMQRRRLVEPEESGAAHDYWRSVVKEGIAPLALPIDGQADLDPWAGAGYVCAVDAQTRANLLDVAAANGSTLFAVMFAAYLYLLSDVCNQRRVACSFVDSGREHASLHDVIGFFVQTVLFGADVDPAQSFAGFLRWVNEELLRMSRFKSYPVELALAELGEKYPDVPVSFNMLNMQDDTAASKLQDFSRGHSTADGDVKFALEPYVREYADGILFTWKYSRQKFKPDSIEYIANRYMALLEFFAAQPDKSLDALRDAGKKRRFKKN